MCVCVCVCVLLLRLLRCDVTCVLCGVECVELRDYENECVMKVFEFD